MSGCSLLPEVRGYRARDLRFDGQRFVLDLVPTRRTARCPLCHRRSRRVHRHHRRTLDDLPIRGYSLRVYVFARHFFCDRRRCPRRIFSERLEGLAAAYARRTQRLAETHGHVTLALGGNAGARLCGRLALETSPSTCLRQVKQLSPLPIQKVRILGVDDWAIRRGKRYGTLLYDLEFHRVVDLLPDRSSESFAQWLKEHPGVEVISRDRAGCYAQGGLEGAPLARQIADRWHLCANASDALERVLIRHHRQIKEVVRSVTQELLLASIPSTVPLSSTEGFAIEPQARREERTWLTEEITLKAGKPPSRERQESADRRARRLDRYTQVRTLGEQGMAQRKIARTVGLDRRTVRRYLQSESFPERASGRSCVGPLDPFGEYLRRRWNEGEHNLSELWREIRERGFGGSRVCVYRFMVRTFGPRPGRGEGQTRPDARPAAMAVPSARRIVSMLLARHELPPNEQVFLDRLREQFPEVRTACEQVIAFHEQIRRREWARFDEWQASAETSGIREIVSFAQGLRPDREAVVAAMTYEWSQGPVEGSVNRLKLIKRSMYGRAGFDLLRRRVLHAC